VNRSAPFLVTAIGSVISLIATILVAIVPAPAYSYEIRAAFAPACPSTDYPKPHPGAQESLGILATAIVTTITGSLIDTGIAALKQKVNPGNATVDGKFLEPGLFTYSTDAKTPVTVADKVTCLVVMVGTFTAAADGLGTWTPPFSSERTAEDASAFKARYRDVLNLKGPPQIALYFEAAQFVSSDKTSITWQPVRLYVGGLLNDDFWAGSSRSTQVEMYLYKPGSDQPFFSEVFPFDAINVGVNKASADFVTQNGTWGVLPAPTVPTGYKPNADGRPFQPFTLEVRVVEAPKPYALAVAFAGAVDTNKDAIKTQVNQAVDPAARRAAEIAADNSTLTDIGTYSSALTAQKTPCGQDANSLDCRLAKDKTNVALAKARASCAVSKVDSCDKLKSAQDQ
jgi:hypothetical protein